MLLELPDEHLLHILAYLGDTIIFEDGHRCPLLAASQVCCGYLWLLPA
jgi:hypothetical protein